jgi:hypothetical protein
MVRRREAHVSESHLRALENALARKGWRVVARMHGHGYRISASWGIQRSTQQPDLLLDFDGMDESGDFCLPVEESYGCQVRGHPAAFLHFRRPQRSRRLWEQELAAFIRELEYASAAESCAAAALRRQSGSAG